MHSNVKFPATFKQQLKAVVINLTGQRKLSRGSINQLLASIIDSNDGAQDLSGGRLLHIKQVYCMNLDCVRPVGCVGAQNINYH